MKNPMFAFATCLRHAFMTGAGYEKEFEKIEVADLDRWTHYDPPSTGAFKTMADIIAASEPISHGFERTEAHDDRCRYCRGGCSYRSFRSFDTGTRSALRSY